MKIYKWNANYILLYIKPDTELHHYFHLHGWCFNSRFPSIGFYL